METKLQVFLLCPHKKISEPFSCTLYMNICVMLKCKNEVVPVHDMMVYVGVEVSFCPFITSSPDMRWMVRFMLQPLSPLEKKWEMGWLQHKNALTKRCVTVSS